MGVDRVLRALMPAAILTEQLVLSFDEEYLCFLDGLIRLSHAGELLRSLMRRAGGSWAMCCPTQLPTGGPMLGYFNLLATSTQSVCIVLPHVAQQEQEYQSAATYFNNPQVTVYLTLNNSPSLPYTILSRKGRSFNS